jgi:hypothetical protein
VIVSQLVNHLAGVSFAIASRDIVAVFGDVEGKASD